MKQESTSNLKSGSLILEQEKLIKYDEFAKSADRVWGCLAFLTSPVFQPPDSKRQAQAVYPDVCWFTGFLGPLGRVRIKAIDDKRTRLEYYPTPLPTLPPVKEPGQGLQWVDTKRPLGSFYATPEEIQRNEALNTHELRVKALKEIQSWLVDQLRILGIGYLSIPSMTDFRFPIKGTPGQFGVLIRDIAAYLDNLHGDKITCQVRKPGSFWELGVIPPEANPLEIRFFVDRIRIDIRASSLADGSTLLWLSNVDGHSAWSAWDLLRDEMERLRCFSLPLIPNLEEQPSPVISQSQEDQSIVTDNSADLKPWERVDDQGDNRALIEYWHNNLTCKEIAMKLGCTEKTIINRVNLLRNQYGAGIVPYRRTIPKKGTS